MTSELMCGRLPQNSLVCSRCREHTRFLRIHWIYFTCPVRERLVWRGESPSAPKEPAGNWAGTLGSVYQNLVQSQSAAEESLKRRFSPSLPVLFVEFTAFLTEPSWSLAHSNKAAPRWSVSSAGRHQRHRVCDSAQWRWGEFCFVSIPLSKKNVMRCLSHVCGEKIWRTSGQFLNNSQ